MTPQFALSGLLIGFLIGLTGVGAGSLMTPVLILILGVKPTIAVGSDLAYSAITKIVGGAVHRSQNTVNRRLAWQIALGSVPGSLLGVWSIHRAQRALGESAQGITLHALGVMLILVAAALLLKSNRRVEAWSQRLRIDRPSVRTAWAVGSGLVIGFLVGVTSVGSGSLFGVLLILVFGLSARETVGTDIYHAAILTSAAAAGHIWIGNVDYRLVGSLLMGSIPGVLLGSRLAGRTPDSVLRPVLAGVLLLSGLKMV